MATLDIQGIPVEFPFKPYDCQLTYMEGVLRALEKATNALLESPTGTGKTLCLLCSTLAWQRRNATMVQNSRVKELAYEPAATDLSKPPPEKTQQQLKQIAGQATSSPSVIIYSSRTHSQLSQVANELKNTVYRPRLSLLGSRDQLCVHEEATLPGKWSQELLDSLSKFPVSQMKGPAKNHACQALVGARRCKYHRGTEGMELAGPASGGNGVGGNGGGSGGQSDLTTVPDIEELVSLARTREFCPYYLGRGQAPRAELVLMPYNYLLDPATRRGIKLNWANSVVIFDEAHNLENVASEAASFELTSAQVAGAQEEALRCHKILTEGGSGGIFDQDKGGAQADDALLVKQALHHLEDAVEGVDLPTGSQGVTRAGEFVYALFGHAGINFDTVKLWLGKLDEMSDTLQENAPFGHAAALKLDCVARAIKVAFRGGHATKQDCLSFAEMYRTHVAPAERTMAPEENGDGRVGRGRGGNRGAGGGAGSAGRVLCFWCFCPGVAMEDLRSLGVRSILVTSGTLSPMSSFANELRLPFEVQVENPHVIGPEQAWIGTLGRGVTNVTLNSSYSNRDNDLYKDELGMTLANLCRIVPGGVLVFFSTYRIMNDCVLRWKHHEGGRTWTRISAHKEPMMEPRTAADLKGVMEEFDSKIANTGGAVFLAVCRGKVSEGMDFSDSRARCVVITGIPYAPAMDAKVILKKKYMSESLLPPGVPRLSGQEWYQQQASRAVNQAIGRVIRHRFDYGCVVLCDQRFSEERNRKNLSLWARPFVRECAGFGRVAADLTRFFKACAANPGLKHTDRSGQSKTPMGPAVPRSNPTSIPGAHPPVRPFTARLRNLTGVGSIAGGGREDAPRSGDSGVDLGGNTSGLQDVGDIVESIGVGRASGAAGSQENSQDGGNHRPGTRSFGLDRKAGVGGTATRVTGAAGTAPSVAAAPMGLLDALRASANAKASAAETMASTDGAKSGAGAGEAADKSGRGDGIGGTWESIPLSQRLAAVGKSAGGVPGSGWRTTAANQKQKHQRDPNKNRSRGVGEHQQGAGSALETRGGAQDVSGVRPRQDRRGGEENARRDGASGKSTALGEPAEIHRDNPTKGSSLGGTSRCSTESETDSRVPSASRDDQKSGVASSGGSSGAGRGEEGGAKAEKKGGSRRQELASLLSDLKSSVSPGAFDVFRSRARAMKEPGVLDTAETALPALRGVLEVLMLAPPELMLPRRFTPHVPEQHGEGYAALLAKHVSPPEGAAAVRKAPRPGRESGAGRGDPAHARARAIPEHSRGSGAQDGEGRRTAGGKRRGPGDGIGNTPGRNAMDRAAKEHVGSQARQTSAVRGAEDRRNTAHDCGAPPRGRGDKVDPGAIAVRGGTPARSKASKSASSAGLSTPGVPPRSKPGLASNPDDGDEGSEDATGGTSKRARLMAAGAGERSHRGGSGSANVKGVCAARGGGTGGAGTKPSPVSRLLEMASSGRKEKKLESNARPRTTDRR